MTSALSGWTTLAPGRHTVSFVPKPGSGFAPKKGVLVTLPFRNEWDTSALPEGKYRVRVEASDEPANPPDQVQKHALESETVLVDNTPPRIETLELTGRRLRAHVVDGTSPIARVEMAVDGKLEWRQLGAADGIFDTADERVDSDVAALVPPGSHIVVVRAFDVAGNAVTRDVETK